MNTIGKICGIILLVLIVLFFARNVMVKSVLEQGVGLVTGLGLDIGRLNIGIVDTKLHIKNFKIFNPRGYEEKIMLDMPEVLIDYNLGNILKGIIHLESVIINLEEFNIVKNKKGELNLDALKVMQEGEKKKKEPAKKEPKKKKGKGPSFRLDNLELVLGQVAFKDYSKEGKPSVNEFKFNVSEKYHDIDNPQIVFALIIQKALLKASVAKLTGFDLGGIQDSLSGAVGDMSKLAGETLDSAKELAGEKLKQVSSLGKSTTSKAKETAQEVTGALKGQAEKVKGLASKLKLPLKRN